jgi:phosphoribosylpyrophosphate synthetase
LISCVKELKKRGATNIHAFITHNLLYPESFRKIESLPITELITTNTIPNVKSIYYRLFKNFSSGKITTLSISKMISKYIEEVLGKLDMENDKH